ncbi:predicted protein [Histoplasma capsulatum G186AR]|uniref:Uncharacterized protein n=1 Tax=Ajellomyces capsulatus (strain G186AR / H82 / ATCC MYA-2454 / RMSCC 2432) TaxID=447093 RepID=C0NGA7_AJECG|nr:uncharacterized protein HCBG_01923 [Histoplasma capsulatum G186AR]EEH10278.1 predicted protein [Histoplasma capsulatum G186AR]
MQILQLAGGGRDREQISSARPFSGAGAGCAIRNEPTCLNIGIGAAIGRCRLIDVDDKLATLKTCTRRLPVAVRWGAVWKPSRRLTKCHSAQQVNTVFLISIKA